MPSLSRWLVLGVFLSVYFILKTMEMETMEDVAGMDMNNTFCHGMGMSMGMMGFGGNGKNCLIFIFNDFILNTKAKYIGAIVLTIVFSIIVDMLRLLSQKYAERYGNSPSFLDAVVMAGVYMVQMVIAYFLMLIVMLFDSGLFAAVILGLGLGRLISLQITASSRGTDGETQPLINSTKNLASSNSPCCNE
eukprot:m.337270 g.337270  ORF g.337270 m.337270 type:complete len:191 (-) comp18088_c0_seq1:143-715(-)